ncbi:MAG TPA: prepilin-type N-terminal cleavage/methylation domain-containing protein [Verrucomicrobiae bacterium]|nr:prepilin-type N-terminal cleavage/methylation domain-containing protein [Verrucomicrobiae bacterium]
MKIRNTVTGGKWQVTGTGRRENRVTGHTSRVTGFTMVEIAICLAIIGIALVAIIGVLPAGLNVQKDNREETLIGQDATVFVENIRNGARGLDDLTNYVTAITNTWTYYKQDGTIGGGGVNGYTYANYSIAPSAFPYPTASVPLAGAPITNGLNIIGLLSTPEYIDPVTGGPVLYPSGSYISNYVVAYVRSMSGPAVEKPPQDNDIIRSDSFSYKMICQNLPAPVYTPPLWTAQQYNAGDEVLYNGFFWRAAAKTGSLDTPGEPAPSPWVQDSYPTQLAANLRELRLTFLWPLLPNGTTGNGRHTFRTAVAGQMVKTSDYDNKELLYFFQPQTFTSVP